MKALIFTLGLIVPLLGSSYFINGQSIENSYLIRSELNSQLIVYPVVIPFLTSFNQNTSCASVFKNKWYPIGKTGISTRNQISLHSGNSNQGIRSIIEGTVMVELTPSLVLQNDYEFDSNGWYDPHYRQGNDPEAVGDWTGYLQHSSLTYFYTAGHLMLGKGNVFTSVFGNSLLLNSNTPPNGMIWWHHQKNQLELDAAVIFMDKVNDTNRFLSYHRYGFGSEKFRVGLSEMVIVSYEQFGNDEFQYLAPASVFFENEINNSLNSNMMWALDFMCKLRDYTIHSEILVDDVALDGESPPKLAFKLGLGQDTDIINYYIEYVRINRWTGNYFYPELRFVDNNVLIGHPYGPDSHSLRFRIFGEYANILFPTLELLWVESGSSDIHDWPEGISAGSNFGWNSEPFPSRPVSTEYISNLKVDYFIGAHSLVRGTAEYNSNSHPEYSIAYYYIP